MATTVTLVIAPFYKKSAHCIKLSGQGHLRSGHKTARSDIWCVQMFADAPAQTTVFTR